MTTAYLGLGSNLGDRRATLANAVAALEAHPGIAVQRVSSLHETRPVGGPPGQGWYLNGVAEVETTLSARGLLEEMHRIEGALGRVRAERDGPRTIDLDLLLHGEEVLDEPGLIVPHPRLHERLFVLEPLAELAPGLVHPRLKRRVDELRADLLGIRPFEAHPGRELRGLRALVTGSTSGIGRAIALELADGGADVIIHGRRSRERADRVAAEVSRRGGRSGVVMADLCRRQERACLADEAWQVWQGLDVLITNAGADTLTGEAAGWSFERKLEELLAVDVEGAISLARNLGRRMKGQGSGVVLTVGWDQAEQGMEGESGELFAASKGAVMAFTRSLALSLAPEVRVLCLAPGWIRTAWGEEASERWQQRVARETPLGRWGMPADVAVMARALVNPRAGYFTGQVVRINGGAVR